MSTRPPRLSGRSLWLATALVVAGVIGGLLTVLDLVRMGPWLPVGVLMVLLVAAVTVLVRRLSRSRTAASAWGLATAVLALGVTYAGEGTRPSLPWPTPSAFERFTDLARSGVEAVSAGRVPVDADRGIELLVVTGALAAFILTELIAIGLRRAGLSGIVVLTLWAPVLIFERSLPVGVLFLGGATFLLLLAITRPPTTPHGSGHGRDATRALLAAAAITALAVVAGPLATSAPLFGTVQLPSTWGPVALDGTLRLSTDLDMRASLSDRSDRPILTYSTDAADLGPLRMFTMDEFDGTRWSRSGRGGDLSPGTDVLWPTETAEITSVEPARVSILVGDLDEERLPIPLEPRAIDIQGRWMYDAVRDEVVSATGTTRGLAYEVTFFQRLLTPEALRGEGPGGIEADSAYLVVPDSEFAAEIEALARELTVDASTTYDRALALQSYFRSIENFRYDTRVPPPLTEDSVWDFLTQRTGYCVQFATAMTVMARTLDIPARLGVGFLPGQLNPEVSDQYVVSGRQAHTWPELYFAETGWVRFEPTPATQTGAPPIYADPFARVPSASPTPTPTAAASPQSSPQATPNAGTAAGGEDHYVGIGSASVPLVAVVALVAALAVLATLGLVGWVSRRRRNWVEPVGPGAWWEELRSRLALRGVAWSDATTVRQAAEQLAEHFATMERRPDAAVDAEQAAAVEAEQAASVQAGQATAALNLLAGAAESERYSPNPGTWPAEELHAWVRAVEAPFTRPDEPEVPGRVDSRR